MGEILCMGRGRESFKNIYLRKAVFQLYFFTGTFLISYESTEKQLEMGLPTCDPPQPLLSILPEGC